MYVSFVLVYVVLATAMDIDMTTNHSIQQLMGQVNTLPPMNLANSSGNRTKTKHEILMEDFSYDIIKSYTFHFDEVNWVTANRDCESKHMHLLSVSGADESALITKKLSALTSITKKVFYWMSGIRDEDGDKFRWWDLRTFNYTKWAKNQPDNFQNAENCACISIYGLWNDASCGLKYSHICEKIELVGESNIQDFCCLEGIKCECPIPQPGCHPALEDELSKKFDIIEQKVNELKARTANCSAQ